MQVAIGNALAPTADPGIERAVLDELDDRVATAHERIAAGRSDGDFGYAALNLPSTADPVAIRETIAGLDPEAVLVVGIGGSALGADTIATALDAPRPVHVLDNVDPAHTPAVLDRLPLAETAMVVVSRSGTTTETLANFAVARGAMDDAGVDWTERTVVVTGNDGPLRNVVDRHDLRSLPVPDGVPGRFAALSTVGLVPAALAGCDVEALLDGAAAADGLAGSLYETPAYAFGAIAHALEERGVHVLAMMPYAEGLEPFAEWFAQLWAESLGKDGRGLAPQRTLGATDQHSQLQRFRSGPRDTMVTFLAPRNRPACSLPDSPDLPRASGDLRTVIDAELRATEGSLAAAGRPNVRVTIPDTGPEAIGSLLYEMEAACVLAGELADVDTFVQPGVEWAKRATAGLLGDGTAESDAIHDGDAFVIG